MITMLKSHECLEQCYLKPLSAIQLTASPLNHTWTKNRPNIQRSNKQQTRQTADNKTHLS